MFRHVVLMSWNDEVNPARVTALADALSALPTAIPELLHYEIGPDAGVNQGNADFAVVADFATAEDYLTYRDHPAHQAVIAEHIAPMLATRSAIQFHLAH